MNKNKYNNHLNVNQNLVLSKIITLIDDFKNIDNNEELCHYFNNIKINGLSDKTKDAFKSLGVDDTSIVATCMLSILKIIYDLRDK